ncbi:MAG: DUF3276 family protein [Planctomycetes bacterium]|nr:DUF3276 family protein [Planctomycetota bacterium]
MARGRRELFTERVTAGSRTYLFDVKESTDGTRYLVISELRQNTSRQAHHRLMIFQEHFAAYNQGYGKAMRFLGIGGKWWRLALRLRSRNTMHLPGAKGKAYSVDEKRQTHPNAYKKWTPENDQQLRKEFAGGANISELAELFQREESAIQSRLKRLGMLGPGETVDGG